MNRHTRSIETGRFVTMLIEKSKIDIPVARGQVPLSKCIRCITGAGHPFCDNGTPNMPDLQFIIDGYTNHQDSAGSKE